ncbi:MAG: twin-arginine translocation signal domain-containing protein [Bacteroidaceae bacterium]|nr:twin-arginine translocation signal domain-containing protein [Bacteroidaceae bacterium]
MSLNRREFLRNSALAASGLAMAASAPMPVSAKSTRGSGFTMWQIPSHRNTIGNSYVFRTKGGKVIVMDGGSLKKNSPCVVSSELWVTKWKPGSSPILTTTTWGPCGRY